jgi:mannose-6-phosphate isomerase-like protein (cupin superfamily)
MVHFGGRQTKEIPEQEPRRESLPILIAGPTRVPAAGNMPKLIDEYVGALNNQETRISVAHMRSPAGWLEPGQTPEFDEYTIVLRGRMRVEHREGVIEISAGQGVLACAGEWIRYSTPDEPAEYIAICLPAFSPATVHRDE